MGCLYSLTSPSGKRYIGISSKDAAARWKIHQMRVREGRPQVLQQAIRKYGADAFVLQTLVIANDWPYLCELEERAIVAFNSRSPNGYNLTKGGEGARGIVHTEQARRNMSIGQKRRFADPVQLARLVAQARIAGQAKRKPRGYKAPWELRKKAQTLKARLPLDEWKRVHSEATKNAMKDPAVAAKVIACAKQRAADPAWRLKVSASKKGQRRSSPYSPEERLRRSEGATRMWLRRKEKQRSNNG